MQFIDKLKMFAKAGSGGDGCLSFRREKYVEFGGPNGGSGGHGGSIFLEADPNLSTLLDLAANPHREAKGGSPGQGSDMTGRGGEDLIVHVPCGTLVYRDSRLIADLTEPGQQVMIAKGGKGGRGNAAFKSNRDRAPRIREKGEPGENIEIELELRLLADVGLLGFPNAGKSTLLASVSKARPKIADYPFTTLSPNLGVVSHRGKTFVLADIPGLIEGAHEGKGLGDEFLRHLARTRVLIHLVDPFGYKDLDPNATIRAIEKEVAAYSRELKDKPRLLVVTKADLTGADEIAKKIRKRYRARKVFHISAAAHKDVTTLLDAVVKLLDKTPVPDLSEPMAIPGDKPTFTIEREDGRLVVRGAGVERLARMTDFALPNAVRRVMNVLKKMGVERGLKKAGVQEGDTVVLGDFELEWRDEAETEPWRTLARRRKNYKAARPTPE